MNPYLIWLLTILTAVGRFLITPRFDIPNPNLGYEAWAHLYVGFMIGMLMGTRPFNYSNGSHRHLLWSLVGLTALEVTMFIIQKNM